MATNPYKNKVIYDGQTLIDLTGDTVTADSLRVGVTAHNAAGEVIVGTFEPYPVGSIYMSVNSTSPATLFGGTWQQLENRFLLGAGSSYTAGATGGEAEHTLTINEMPSHRHDLAYGGTQRSSGTWNLMDQRQTDWSGSTYWRYGNYINDAGGDQAHNNMPPYLVVYMWQRTA